MIELFPRFVDEARVGLHATVNSVMLASAVIANKQSG